MSLLPLLLHSGACADLPSVSPKPYMREEERALLEKHMVDGIDVLEYGSGGSTLYFTEPDNKFNIKSWSCVDHNHNWAGAVLAELDSRIERRLNSATKPRADEFSRLWSLVRMSFVPADMSDWQGQPLLYEEGNLNEYYEYVYALVDAAPRQIGVAGEAPLLLINDGRARVDVGVAALPILTKYGGLMALHDYPHEDQDPISSPQRICYSTLLQFYDVVEQVESLVIMKPKPAQNLINTFYQKAEYEWCFSWQSGGLTMRLPSAPAKPGDIFPLLQELVPQCSGEEMDGIVCPSDGLRHKAGLFGGCVPCSALVGAILRRGDAVTKAILEIYRLL